MNSTRLIGAASLAVCSGLLLLAPPLATAAPDASPLAAKYNCQACHTVDKKLVGPSYKEVAAKYACDSGAPAKLEQKIKNGGSGAWGRDSDAPEQCSRCGLEGTGRLDPGDQVMASATVLLADDLMQLHRATAEV